MITRIPEPELMDDESQAKAYSEADFSISHEQFCALAQRVYPLEFCGHVLDLGCGPADVIVRFLKRFTETRVTGIDGSAQMLRLARARIKAHGFSKRVQLHQALLSRIPTMNPFDGLISNSLLHHLKEPSELWTAIEAMVCKGGPVFIMDLYRPSCEDELHDKVSTHTTNAPSVLKRDFEASLYAAYTVPEVKNQLQRASLSHLKVDYVSELHLAIWGHR